MYGGHKGLHPWHHWSLFGHVYCDPTKTASSFLRGLANGRSYQKKRDYYEVLGVKRNATQEEIKAAFYAKSKKLHPDKGTNGNGSNSTADFVDLKEAYDVLRRPADRRAYDLRGFEYERLKHQDPYYYYKRRQQQQQRADSGFWGTSGNMRDSEFKRQSEDQWRFIWKLTAIGVAFVVVYNVVYVLQLRTRERKIAQLVDEDEIAKSFMRQPEFRNTTIDDLEMQELARVLKGNVDEAWRRKQESLVGKNPNEIREEYRWFRAVQDADRTRRLKAERAERRRKERQAARGSDPASGHPT